MRPHRAITNRAPKRVKAIGRQSGGVAAAEAGVPLPTVAAVLGDTPLAATAIRTTAIGARHASS